MFSKDRLLILDADGTTINAFSAIEQAFAIHDMNIGDLERFQKRRHLFKYLGGLKEAPRNLRHQFPKKKRAKLIETLTEVYREDAVLYEGMGPWINRLIDQVGLRVGVITRNITNEPIKTMQRLLRRHDVDVVRLDFLRHLPLAEDKTAAFQQVRADFLVNPARAYACGDEKKDYVAALSNGMHPFMVAYGFEDFERLTSKIGVPAGLISKSPAEFQQRVCNALDIDGISENDHAVIHLQRGNAA